MDNYFTLIGLCRHRASYDSFHCIQSPPRTSLPATLTSFTPASHTGFPDFLHSCQRLSYISVSALVIFCLEWPSPDTWMALSLHSSSLCSNFTSNRPALIAPFNTQPTYRFCSTPQALSMLFVLFPLLRLFAYFLPERDLREGQDLCFIPKYVDEFLAHSKSSINILQLTGRAHRQETYIWKT